jgi:prepilin-type N-terminal cleavage/methylation domain-containing protein
VKQRGFSLLEILVVLAILGILAWLGGRAILRSHENCSSLYFVRQIFWQGASAAASRGKQLGRVRSSDIIQVRPVASPVKVICHVELSRDVTLSLPQGQIATFSPIGKVVWPNLVNVPHFYSLLLMRGLARAPCSPQRLEFQTLFLHPHKSNYLCAC